MNGAFVRAAAFAARKHAGQRRRGSGAPYINHPLAVAEAALEAGERDPDTLCAAVLHDVVEDTDATREDVAALCGEAVAALVMELTDRPEWSDLDVLERKGRQAEKFRSASRAAQAVKIADQWSNIDELALFDAEELRGRMEAYLETSRQVVEVCRAANPALAARFDEAAARLQRKMEGEQT